ncbi:MAG: peptide chain release factor N(5)-glutamine methyltransferase [Candidatus Omnitrophica bacterium]|nr:peptide chain release factor N(5)-glutamine methyltransferase [Candidatus Omnitrophota bacterium]
MKLTDWLLENKSVFNDTDLRFLLKEAFNSSHLFTDDAILKQDQLDLLNNAKRLHKRGEPLAYILGKEIFFGLEFKVDDSVLIPRKETELICLKAIDVIEQKSLNSVLDLGCGSANMAISIIKSIDRKIFAVASDISPKALKTAELNVIAHKIDLKLVNSNLLSSFKEKSFELIITNPPYVEKDLIRGSLVFEPRIALEAGEDGLLYIREIISQAHRYLKEGGFIIMEIGFRHKEMVESLVKDIKRYDIKEWIKDYGGHYRGVVLAKIQN